MIGKDDHDGGGIGSFNLKFHRSETLFHREIKSENEGNTARMLVEYVAM